MALALAVSGAQLTIALSVVPLAQGAVDATRIVALLEARQDAQVLGRVRANADGAREALGELFQLSVSEADEKRRASRLGEAARLARLYLQAWSDSFLLESVERFRRWSVEQRREKVLADSLR